MKDLLAMIERVLELDRANLHGPWFMDPYPHISFKESEGVKPCSFALLSAGENVVDLVLAYRTYTPRLAKALKVAINTLQTITIINAGKPVKPVAEACLHRIEAIGSGE